MNPVYRTTVFEGPAVPPRSEFWIVTAHNPGGTVQPPEANRAADEALRRALQSQGLPHWRVTGRSPDGTHREPGWALAGEDAAHELARRHRQLALYHVQGDRLFLLATGARREEAVALGSWSARLVGPARDSA